MKEQAVFVRTYIPSVGSVLVPIDPDGKQMVDGLQLGQEVMVTFWTTRNPVHHRLFFHLLNIVVENGAWDGSLDDLRRQILYRTGHVTTTILRDGGILVEIDSMKFTAMSQSKFKRFFDRAVYYISTKILGSPEWETVRDEVHAAADGALGEALKTVKDRWG